MVHMKTFLQSSPPPFSLLLSIRSRAPDISPGHWHIIFPNLTATRKMSKGASTIYGIILITSTEQSGRRKQRAEEVWARGMAEQGIGYPLTTNCQWTERMTSLLNGNKTKNIQKSHSPLIHHFLSLPPNTEAFKPSPKNIIGTAAGSHRRQLPANYISPLSDVKMAENAR